MLIYIIIWPNGRIALELLAKVYIYLLQGSIISMHSTSMERLDLQQINGVVDVLNQGHVNGNVMVEGCQLWVLRHYLIGVHIKEKLHYKEIKPRKIKMKNLYFGVLINGYYLQVILIPKNVDEVLIQHIVLVTKLRTTFDGGQNNIVPHQILKLSCFEMTLLWSFCCLNKPCLRWYA